MSLRSLMHNMEIMLAARVMGLFWGLNKVEVTIVLEMACGSTLMSLFPSGHIQYLPLTVFLTQPALLLLTGLVDCWPNNFNYQCPVVRKNWFFFKRSSMSSPGGRLRISSVQSWLSYSPLPGDGSFQSSLHLSVAVWPRSAQWSIWEICRGFIQKRLFLNRKGRCEQRWWYLECDRDSWRYCSHVWQASGHRVNLLKMVE